MSLKTKRALTTRVLRQMQIVGTVETPPAEYVTRVGDIYDTKLEEWRGRDVVYWDNTDLDTAEIPIAAFEPLASLLINEAEDGFGKNPKTELQRKQIEERLLIPLRRHTQAKTAKRPNHASYF